MSESEGYTEVYAWGADRYGQLGLGNKHKARCYSIPRFCTFNVIICKVACGDEHSAFITSNGSVYTMGSNADGRLGIGDRSVKLSSTPCLVEELSWFKAVEVSCGWGHTAVILDNGKVFTWGVGEYGALGISDCKTQWFPIQVVFKEKYKVNVKSVSCGTRHTAMVDEIGRLFVCGAGDAGQLGTGTRERQIQPVNVHLREKVKSAACGIFHTLILTSNGTVLSMGGNNSGQLGTGVRRSSAFPVQVEGLERVVKIAAGYISAALTEKGVVYLWGAGPFGEWLVPTVFEGFNELIKDIQIGANFGAAVDHNGDVYAWGTNSNGELGLGDYNSRSKPYPLNSMKGKSIVNLSCGGSYVLALGRTVPHKYVPSAQMSSMSNSSIQESKEKSTYSPIQPPPKESAKSFNLLRQRDIPMVSRQTVIESVKAPSQIEMQYEDMLEAYKTEQQRCKDLRHRISELQKLSYRSGHREVNIESINVQRERLLTIESQLEAERNNYMKLINKLEEERRRANYLDPELEQREEELKIAIRKLQQENVQLQNKQRENKNVKISLLLKDYEERIAKEIEERRRITKEKAAEIYELQEEVSRLEDAISAIGYDKEKIAGYYIKEIEKIEQDVSVRKSVLEREMAEKESILGAKKKDELTNTLLEKEIAKLKDLVEGLDADSKRLNGILQEMRGKLRDREIKVREAKERESQLLELIQKKEMEYNRTLQQFKNNQTTNIEEIKNLQLILQEKVLFNKELQETILKKVVEIDVLNKDVAAWIEVSDNARNDNTSLKKLIEELESKNRKLMESMNLHMFNRAAEYKERTIRALKASQSPHRINKLKSSGYKLHHVMPSPERFDKFMEEEKKNTKKGIANVINLTQFKADTVASLKERNVKRSNLKTPEPKVTFDGRFVIDQHEYQITEDPLYVKSNYVLSQMLDKYTKDDPSFTTPDKAKEPEVHAFGIEPITVYQATSINEKVVFSFNCRKTLSHSLPIQQLHNTLLR
jgi:X-linked retinitis pigmentosa GTPase regulator